MQRSVCENPEHNIRTKDSEFTFCNDVLFKDVRIKHVDLLRLDIDSLLNVTKYQMCNIMISAPSKDYKSVL